MSTSLPPWRRSVTTRFTCIMLAALAAAAWHAWRLDSNLPLRLIELIGLAFITAGCLFMLVPGQTTSRSSITPLLLDGATQAILLAALWPATHPLWPVLVALPVALLLQRLLGGWAVNPYPPVLMAAAIGIGLVRIASGPDFTPELASLVDTSLVAAGWLVLAIVLIGVRIWAAPAPLAFVLTTAPFLAMGGIASISFVITAILAGFVLADTRHLPVTSQGQWLLGVLAGLGAACPWLLDAPPLFAIFPVLGVFALMPWIETMTLRKSRARPA